MRLVSAVLGFLLRKLGLFLAVLLSLFLGYLLIQAVVPSLRQAAADRDRLAHVAEERRSLEADLAQLRTAAVTSQTARIDAEVDELRQSISQGRSKVGRLRKDRDDACGPIKEFIQNRTPLPDTCKAKRKLYEKAAAAQEALERNLGRAQRDAAVLSDPDLSDEQKLQRIRGHGGPSPADRQIDSTTSELDQTKAEEKSLRTAQGSWAGWLVTRWSTSWKWLAGIALLALLTPPVLRTVSYFVLMPLVRRWHKPIHLAAGSEHVSPEVRAGPAERTLPVHIPAGEVLSARSEHVRPVRGKARSQVLYDWGSPFISYAAGLRELSRITGDEDGTEATLATPDDPNSYLMRIDFEDHPGLVMHPKHVVGVLGSPELRTRWRWGIHSFATWQVRYIMFAGTGSLIVQGSGDVVATSPGGRSTRIEQNLVMGFDSRLSVGVSRTEVFLPYLRGKTPLIDDEFTGSEPLFWQKSTADGPTSPIARTFDAIFSALGKLLGF